MINELYKAPHTLKKFLKYSGSTWLYRLVRISVKTESPISWEIMWADLMPNCLQSLRACSAWSFME